MCKNSFFFVISGYIFFLISFSCLPSLISTSLPSPFFLLLSSSSLLPVVFRCLCCVSVLCSCRLFYILCCRRFLCFVLSLVAAALLRCCRWLLRGCRCCCFSRFGAVLFFDPSVHFRCHSSHCWVVVRCILRVASCARELVITMMMDADACSNSL